MLQSIHRVAKSGTLLKQLNIWHVSILMVLFLGWLLMKQFKKTKTYIYQKPLNMLIIFFIFKIFKYSGYKSNSFTNATC